MTYGTSYKERQAPPLAPRPRFPPCRRPGPHARPVPAQARSRRALPPASGHARYRQWRTRSCSSWRGASAPIQTSPSRACYSGAERPRGAGQPEGPVEPWVPAGPGRCPARWVGMSGYPWTLPQGIAAPTWGPDLLVTSPVLARQGHLAPPEGSQLLPRLHQSPSKPPEEDPWWQDRLHRGQVEGPGQGGPGPSGSPGLVLPASTSSPGKLPGKP